MVCMSAPHASEDIRFDVFKDSSGKRHISIIPKQGYDQRGNIKEAYNPNSIVHQHAELVRKLKKENLEILLQPQEDEVEISGISDESSPESDTPATGNIFYSAADNKTVLEELIELEKRAGRTAPVQKP